jgi:hypothetical protein
VEGKTEGLVALNTNDGKSEVTMDSNVETDGAELTLGLIDGETEDDGAVLGVNEGSSEGVAVGGTEDGEMEVDGIELIEGFVDGDTEDDGSVLGVNEGWLEG